MVNSAFIGQPPATQEDYYVAKALLAMIGMVDVDPHQGFPAIPPRPPPALYHAESRAGKSIRAYSISISFIIVITLSRLGIRAFNKRVRWGLDDWLILAAFPVALAWPVLGLCAVVYGGVGHHMYDVTYHEYQMFNLFAGAQYSMFYVAVALIKMSIIAFNMRLTGLTSRRWMIAHWTFFGTMIVYALLTVFLTNLWEDPPRARFDLIYAGKLSEPLKIKANIFMISYFVTSIHVASDILLLSFFAIVLWKIQMSWAVKLRLFVVFAIGAVSFISAIQWQLAIKTGAIDVLWNIDNQINWTCVDLTAGVTVASLPVLSSVFVATFNSLVGSLFSFSRSSGSPSGDAHRYPSRVVAQNPRRWHGQSLLEPSTHSNDSRQEVEPENGKSIYADTPGWEQPRGHVEEKEKWTSRKTARHHEEG